MSTFSGFDRRPGAAQYDGISVGHVALPEVIAGGDE